MEDIRHYINIVESAFNSNALPYKFEITRLDKSGDLEVHLLFSSGGLIELGGHVEKSNESEYDIKFDDISMENPKYIKSVLSLDSEDGIDSIVSQLQIPLLKSKIMSLELFKSSVIEGFNLDENINPDRWKRVHNNKYLARSKYEERLKKLDDYMQKQKEKINDKKNKE